MRKKLHWLLIACTIFLASASAAWWHWGQAAGVRLEYYLSRQPEIAPAHKAVRPRLDFSLGQGMSPHPRGGGFCLVARGVLHPPRAGRHELAVVSLGRADLRIAGQEKSFPPLGQWPAPAGLTARGNPGGPATAALDRDPKSRFTSGRPKTGGEDLVFSLARPARLLGLVLDSAMSGFGDAPAGFRVEHFQPGQGWRRLAEKELPRRKASTVDAFFPSSLVSRFKVRQTGRDGRYWWSVNEAYPIFEAELAARALAVELSGPAPFRLFYRPPAEEEAPGKARLRRDYSLLRLYWRAPGGPWQIVPAGALAARPLGNLAGLAAFCSRLAPWLPWGWALLASAWLWLLAAGWRGAATPRGQSDAAPAWPAWAALALGAAGAAGLPLASRYFENFMLGPGAPAPLDLRLLWLAGGAAIFLACLGLALWGPARRALRGLGWPAAAAGLLLCQAAFLILWVQALGWDQPLTSDDHGIFLYGHHQWDQTPPASSIYTPWWNAGALEWEAVRNGSAGLYLLSRPFTFFLPIAKAYTLATPLVFALLLPWLSALALRRAGLAPGAALLGAVLLLLPLPQWVYWLKEGSNGGIVAAGLCLPILVLFLELLESPRPRCGGMLALALAFTLALFWMPFAFAAALPCALALAIYLPQQKGARLWRLLAFLAGVALFNLLWLGPFLANFPLFNFAGSSSRAGLAAVNWPAALGRLFFLLGEINPLILVPGLWGLVYLPLRRRLVLLAFLANACLLVALEQAAPSMQLWRMWQFFAVGLIWPAALCWQRLARLARTWPRALAWACLACLLAGSLLAPGLYYAQKLERRQSSTAPPVLTALATWLGRPHAPAGRVLLAGPTAMQYHGCAGWLQMYAGKPMIADFYVKYLDRRLEVNLPPDLCLSPPAPQRYARLLRRYDVGQVLSDAAEPGNPWPAYLDGLPFLRRIKTLDERFVVWGVDLPGRGRLQKGRARVTEGWGGLMVYPQGPGPLVLKYHWLPNLTAGGAARLRPAGQGQDPPLIAASGHQGQPFRIRLGNGIWPGPNPGSR